MYRDGQGIEQDYKLAIECFKKASDHDHGFGRGGGGGIAEGRGGGGGITKKGDGSVILSLLRSGHQVQSL